MKTNRLCLGLLLSLPFAAFSQPDGKLQIHFIDVGQGDAEFLVSPAGETILIDGGLPGKDQAVNAYLASHQFTNVDYYIATHYHRDHIGCAVKLLTPARIQHLKAVYDRGDVPADTDSFSNKTTTDFIKAVRTKRVTAQSSPTAPSGHSFKLDANSAHPVAVEFFAVNGNGHVVNAAKNENDLSVSCVVRFGGFSAVLGGDLSGSNGSQYSDIETSAAAGFTRPVTVYKTHHHGSRYSSNTNWLNAINPVVGIICCGTKNTYYLPEDSALQRLADFKVDTYWTETGGKQNPDARAGAAHVANADKSLERVPDPGKHQYLGGDIIVEAAATGATFEVITHNGQGTHTITYQLAKPPGDWGKTVSGAAPAGNTLTDVYEWSSLGHIYHVASCPAAALLSHKYLETGATPPPGYSAHSCVQ
jgi:beta-lactamase superfamily II metal-dependent hydrolase